MKKFSQVMLLATSTILTLLLALMLLHFFAPGLLGEETKIEVVQAKKKKVDYFENIFRKKEFENPENIDHIHVPNFYRRMTPLASDLEKIGPTDLIGYRNRNIPSAADVIAIGDSQTHGINATIEENWPGRLKAKLHSKNTTLYNMSIGGWGAVEYYESFKNAIYFNPYVVIIAFYTGNDPLDTYARAFEYKGDRWRHLRGKYKDTKFSKPKVRYPPRESDKWTVSFKDGTKTRFTALIRYASNKNHPAVKAGFYVMLNVAQEIAKIAKERKINLIFTVIPTKELVFSTRLENEGIQFDDDYKALVKSEKENIERFSNQLMRIEHTQYVDVVAPLQESALLATDIYPSSADGHPLPAGYDVIAEALRPHVQKSVPKVEDGLYSIVGKRHVWVVVKNGMKRLIDSKKDLDELNLDPKKSRRVKWRYLTQIPFAFRESAQLRRKLEEKSSDEASQ